MKIVPENKHFHNYTLPLFQSSEHFISISHFHKIALINLLKSTVLPGKTLPCSLIFLLTFKNFFVTPTKCSTCKIPKVFLEKIAHPEKIIKNISNYMLSLPLLVAKLIYEYNTIKWTRRMITLHE